MSGKRNGSQGLVCVTEWLWGRAGKRMPGYCSEASVYLQVACGTFEKVDKDLVHYEDPYLCEM